MWFKLVSQPPDWTAAEHALGRTHPELRTIIRRVGPCTLAPRRDPFVALCQSIYTQQISTTIATVLFERFRSHLPRKRVTPSAVLRFLDTASPEIIRRCGLSRQKQAYIRDLAEHFDGGRIPIRRLAGMTDEEVVEALTQVKGVGRWTAEMFLIFVLNRPDVWPIDDLGLQEGLREVFTLPHRPTRKEANPLGDSLRPWRSIATWYLWRRNFKPT